MCVCQYCLLDQTIVPFVPLQEQGPTVMQNVELFACLLCGSSHGHGIDPCAEE